MNKRQRKAFRRQQLANGARLYAWYSAKMDDSYGHSLYRRPDREIIKITCVSSKRSSGLGWDDVKYCGKVIGYRADGFVYTNKKGMDMNCIPSGRDVERAFEHRMTIPLLVLSEMCSPIATLSTTVF